MNDNKIKKVIIDTDMLIDDWMAILYLLNNQDIDVIGISVTGTGGCYLNPGSRNALALLKILGQDYKIPVVAGAEQPLIYSNVYPQDVRKNAAFFMNIDIPSSDAPLTDKPVIDFYIDLLKAQTAPIYILSIGGGTNLGWLLESPKFNDEVKSKISQIVVMAGAVDVPGNLGDLTSDYSFNAVAEWNVFVDVKGMSHIFQSGLPILLLPLDACNQVILDEAFIDEFESKTEGVAASYVLRMLKKYIGSGQNFPVFDPLAACVLANINSSKLTGLVAIEKICLSINQNMIVSGNPDYAGQLKRNSEAKEIDICTKADKNIFTEIFISAFA